MLLRLKSELELPVLSTQYCMWKYKMLFSPNLTQNKKLCSIKSIFLGRFVIIHA